MYIRHKVMYKSRIKELQLYEKKVMNLRKRIRGRNKNKARMRGRKKEQEEGTKQMKFTIVI